MIGLAAITFDYTPPLPVVAGGLILALLLCLLFFHLYLPRSAPSWTILAVRILFLALLGWVILLPHIEERYTEQIRQNFVVVLDRSLSMTLTPAETVPSRWDVANEFLQQPWVRHLQREYAVDFYLFGGEVESVARVQGLRDASPTADSTRLRDALHGLTERYRGQDVAGLILLSDGLDTREADDSWAVGPWNFPLFVADLEEAATWEVEPDVRVENIIAQRRVMVGWETSLTAVVSGQGVGSDPVPVQLFRDGELIREIPTQIPQDGGRREVPFTVANLEVGDFNYTVRIPALPGESNIEDNEFSIAVQVIEAENRMLYVEGLPRWESRYLSRALRANPDLTPTILMFIGGEFRSMGEATGISLDMTDEDLAPFSVLIVGDFSADVLGDERAAALLRFVEEGGSLILLGGPSAWGQDGLIRTALRPVIPFRTTAPAVAREARYSPRLTPEGRQHPAFIDGEDLLDWSDLPPILSVFPVRDLSPAATALAEVEADGQRFPLIVSQRYGEGWVLSILTDSLWRWQLEPRDDRPYLRFWNQVLNWLGPSEDDRETETFDLFADSDQIYLGESIQLTARLPERLVAELASPSVRLEMELPDRRRLDLAMLGQTITTATGQTFPGYGVAFTANESGLHRAVARVRHDGEARIESAPFTFYVRAFTAETEPRPTNRQVLETLASSSGGVFHQPAELDAVLREKQGRHREESRLRYRTLWNTWAVLICLIGLLVVEWIIRKARNYV